MLMYRFRFFSHLSDSFSTHLLGLNLTLETIVACVHLHDNKKELSAPTPSAVLRLQEHC